MIVTLVTALLSMSNDYVGLKRFYEATNGASWIMNDNWLNDDPCTGKWHGVLCDKSKRDVIGVNLYSNALSGTMPTALGQLTALTGMSFRINALSGTCVRGDANVPCTADRPALATRLPAAVCLRSWDASPR